MIIYVPDVTGASVTAFGFLTTTLVETGVAIFFAF